MPDFLIQLKDAFSESVNYLTWSFFSFVAAFAMYHERKEKKVGWGLCKTFLYFWFIRLLYLWVGILLIIGFINIIYVVEIFGKYYKGIEGYAIGIVTVVAGINAGVVVWGIKGKNN